MAKCVVPDPDSESETFVASIDVKLMDENKNILKDIPQSDITSLELEEELEDPSMFSISLNNSKDLSEKKIDGPRTTISNQET